MEYKVQAFDSISDEVLSLAGAFSREISPDLDQLAEFAAAGNTPVRVVAVFDGDSCVALACCIIDYQRLAGQRLRVYRNLGAGFYDYTSLLHAPGCRDVLLRGLVADAEDAGVDGVFLNNMLSEDSAPPAIGSLYTKQTVYYQTRGEAEPYATLLRKKSVKRHVNKCRRELDYRCEHLVGDAITASHIESLGVMHVETRRFHGTDSAFNRPETVAEYLASRHSRVLTRILNGEEVVAYHYGLLFADQMIWHTPVVNVKYLAYSPLEVLLYETISYCRDGNINVFDLGIGDEVYKQRFSNRQRMVRDIFLPISRTAKTVGRIKDAEFRYSLKDRAARLSTALQGTLQQSFPEILSGVRNFVSPPGFELKDGGEGFRVLDGFPDFVDFCRGEGLAVTADHYQYYRNGAKLTVLLNDDGKVLVHGWQNRSESMRLPELHRSISTLGGVMVWDLSRAALAVEQDVDRFIRHVGAADESGKLFVLTRKAERGIEAYLRKAGFQRSLLSFTGA